MSTTDMYIKQNNKSKKKTGPFQMCGVGLLYYLMLCIGYVYFVYPYYEYAGFSCNYDVGRFLLSLLFVVIILFILPLNKTLTTFFLTIQNILTYIPMAVLYVYLETAATSFFMLVSICYIVQIILVRMLTKNRKEIDPFLGWTRTSNIYLNLMLLFSLITVVLSIVFVRFPTLSAFNLDNIYDIRGDNSYSALIEYLSSWTAKIILPFVFIYGLDRRQYFKAFLSIALLLVLFMIFAHKTYLFVPIMLIGVYVVCKMFDSFFNLYFFAAIGVVAVLVLFVVTDNLFPPSLYIRRLLFIPARLKFKYYEFFSINAKVCFADGRIGELLGLSSPYDRTIPFVVSNYIGEPESNANTGYWADAYANAGVVGVIMFSVLLALMIIWLENHSKKLPTLVVIASMSFTFVSLNDGALLTNILTGGMFLFFIIFYMFSKAVKHKKIPLVALRRG